MKKSVLRDRVRKLRAEGKTYSEIKKNLGVSVPKSTLSNWCKEVVLPNWYLNKVREINNENLTKAQARALASIKIKREIFLEEVRKESERVVQGLDLENLKIILAVLYLGEGAKWKSHRGLMLGSSDPDTIRLYIKLLDICYGIKPHQMKCRVSHRADQKLKALERFWSRVTGIPLINFYKSIPDPRTKGKPTKNKNYKGVCVVTCGGTNIQLELETIPKIILRGL